MWKNVDVDTAILEAVIGQVDKIFFCLKLMLPLVEKS